MNEPLTVSGTSLPRRQVWREPQAHFDAIERGFTQGALALSYPMPGGLPAEPSAPATRRLSSLALVPELRATPTPCTPDTHAWALRFVQAVVEVISADRPLTQLLRWTDEAVYVEIAQRQRCAMRRRAAGGSGGTQQMSLRQHVASVHVSHPTDLAAEVTARVMTPRRSRALAARLDYERDRWTCTAIAFG